MRIRREPVAVTGNELQIHATDPYLAEEGKMRGDQTDKVGAPRGLGRPADSDDPEVRRPAFEQLYHSPASRE